MYLQDQKTPPNVSAQPVDESATTMDGLIGRFTDGQVSTDDMAFAWTAVGLPAVKAIVLIVILMLAASWVRRIVIRTAENARVETTLARFFGAMARWTVLVIGAITVMQTFGIEATSFAAVLAAVGFAIGMSLSGTLGNVAAGLMLLMFRPYKVGDTVSCGGTKGKVFEIGLFTTIFDTHDNRRITVPNGSIFGSTIENWTFHDTRKVEVLVGIEYSADLNKSREVLLAAVDSIEGGLKDPEPVVYLKELGGSSIDWSIRVWSKTEDFWAVRERMTQAIKEHLDAADIGIPFPQMDVHLDKVGE